MTAHTPPPPGVARLRVQPIFSPAYGNYATIKTNANIDNQSDNRDEKQNLSGKREGARKKEKEGNLGKRKGENGV
jgi:hypothetical protein